MSGIWERYYKSCQAVLFVVDAADLNRLSEVQL